MRLITGLSLLLSLGTSCTIKSHKYFTNCVDNMPTGIDKLIRTDGYYIPLEEKQTPVMVFYADGACAYVGYVSTHTEAEQAITAHYKGVNKRHYWGRYRIDERTIKVQSFTLKEMFYEVVNETWYEATSDTTLVAVRDMCGLCAGMPGSDSKGVTINFPRHNWIFVPFHSKPDSSLSVINHKRWAQCSRRRYRQPH